MKVRGSVDKDDFIAPSGRNDGTAGKETVLFVRFKIKMTIIYQDRLGINIGKALKKRVLFYRHRSRGQKPPCCQRWLRVSSGN